MPVLGFKARRGKLDLLKQKQTAPPGTVKLAMGVRKSKKSGSHKDRGGLDYFLEERYKKITATVKLEVQLRHRLPPSLERSGKGGGRRW